MARQVELLDRVPPQDLDAERCVLASVMIDPRVMDELATEIRPDDFYLDSHRVLYEAMSGIHEGGKRITTDLLLSKLKKSGDLNRIGGMPALVEIMDSSATSAHALYHAQQVRDAAILRGVIEAGTEMIQDGHSGREPREVLNRAERSVLEIQGKRVANETEHISEVLHDALARIEEQRSGKTFGVPSGFPSIDAETGGLHDGELIIVAGRPSMGKTALALNLAEAVSCDGQRPTLLISLEMSRLELAQRMLISRSGVSGNRVRAGTLNADDRSAITETCNALAEAKLHIDDNGTLTVTEIASIARRAKRKNDLRLLVVDYLQLIEPDDTRDVREQQVARMTRRLKQLARELEIPVVCLSQLNRKSEQQKDQRPSLGNLRESGAIEQDADGVWFVHRDEYYQPANPDVRGKATVIIAKQRNGPTGDVSLEWHRDVMRFVDPLVPTDTSGDFLDDHDYPGSY